MNNGSDVMIGTGDTAQLAALAARLAAALPGATGAASMPAGREIVTGVPLPGAARSPFQLLREMACATRAVAAGLPRAREVAASGWRGLGVQLGGLRFVATIGEAVEVMHVPRLTPVPWVQPFVLGLANVRGRLLPVFDVHRLLQLTPTRPRNQWRVMVVQDGVRLFGLTIEQSFGIQQFPQDARCAEPFDLGEVNPFVETAYRHGGRVWYVLAMRRLVQHPAFVNVAV